MNPLSPLSESLPDRLGLCALHFLWQGAVLAAGLALLLSVCRRGTAELRSALCGVTLLLMAAAPLVTWLRLAPAPEQADSSAAASADLAFLKDFTAVPEAAGPAAAEGQHVDKDQDKGSGSAAPRTPAPSSPSLREAALQPPVVSGTALPWQRWLGWCWVAGAALMALWRGHSLAATVWLIRSAEGAAGPLADRIAVLARRSGLRLAPAVRITARLASPAVAGVFRPVLLLPAAALAGLSPRELEFILAHEFAHIRRQDFLTGLLQAAVETLLFFHPAVWWVSARLNAEREHACDDAAARVTGDRRSGATALARLAELQLAAPPALLPGAAGGRLLTRIRRLLQPASRGSGLPALFFPLLTLLAFLPVLAVQRAESGEPHAEVQPAPEEVAAGGSRVPLMRGSITDRNGVVLAESYDGTWTRNGKQYAGERRRYPLGSLGSHVLGYTRQGEGETEPDTGMSGIEKVADELLRSVPAPDGKPGAALALTLDARIQLIAEQALRQGGVGRGAAVVIDPNTGDILAMASVPDFDPNDFVPFLRNDIWEKARQDPTWPLLNRAMNSFAPGSPSK